MRLAVVTVVAGRHDHLRAQHRSLAEGERAPDLVVVVSLGDPDVRAVVSDGAVARSGRTETLVEEIPCDGPGLPVAAGRNRGAALALRAGADLLVMLDVDCLAGPALLPAYAAAAGQAREDRPALLAGPVAYLAPKRPGRTSYTAQDLAASRPHPARPAPHAGSVRRAEDLRLFWSLSFAVRAEDWTRIGGFDEGYVGYGGEDTDFAQRAGSQGAEMWWVGDAVAYHQWHPVSNPPVEHLENIVRNANRFHRRWGWFPMEGWLAAFSARGLAHHDGVRDRWVGDRAGGRLSPARRGGRGGRRGSG